MQERAEGEEGGDRCGVPTFLYFPFLAVRYKRAPSSSSGWPGTGSWPSGDLVSLVGLVRDDLGLRRLGMKCALSPDAPTPCPAPSQTNLATRHRSNSPPGNGVMHVQSKKAKRVVQPSRRRDPRRVHPCRASGALAGPGGRGLV